MSVPPALHPILAEDLAEIVADDVDWELLCGRRLLLTGAAGFLPAYMAETVLHLNATRNLDCTVVGLVRNLGKARARFAAHAGRRDLQLVQADVSQPLPALEPCSVIVHAASQASPKFYGTDPVGTMTANILGIGHLLEAARLWKGEKFLFFSSGEVYGRPERVPTREEDYGYLDILNTRSCYGESKRAAETLAACYAQQHGVPCTMARPSHTYGPGMDLHDGRVFADFVRDAVEKKDIVMKSDGTAVRSFCYLADATRAFFRILLHGTPGQAYNTGHPEGAISIGDLARLVVGLRPEANLRVEIQARAADGYVASPTPVGHPDVSRLCALGWRPRHDLASGFSRTIRSFLPPGAAL